MSVTTGIRTLFESDAGDKSPIQVQLARLLPQLSSALRQEFSKSVSSPILLEEIMSDRLTADFLYSVFLQRTYELTDT